MSENANPKVTAISINDLVEWAKGKTPNGLSGSLLLPPIQRTGGQWSRQQIAEYWDSLLRGFPLATMLIHKVAAGQKCRSLIDDRETIATESDYGLFDGQQRLSAILLGFGIGSLKQLQKLKIWIGDQPNDDSKNEKLLFPINFSSAGQPFGYRSDFNKLSLDERRQARLKWIEAGKPNLPPAEIFESAKHDDLAAQMAVYRHELSEILNKKDFTSVLGTKLSHLLRQDIAEIDHSIPLIDISLMVPNQDEIKTKNQKLQDYKLYFRRIGQNGTSLTDNEYIYSVIKESFPEIHQTCTDIFKPVNEGGCGNISTPVELTIAALRVAQAKNSKTRGRPGRDFADRIDSQSKEIQEFKQLIDGGKNSRIFKAVKHIRACLEFDPVKNPKGLSLFMLAQLPRELFDCLLLAAVETDSSTTEDSQWMIPLSLYWIVLLDKESGFANWFYSLALGYNSKDENGKENHVTGKKINLELIKNLIKDCEDDKTCSTCTRISDLDKILSKHKIGKFLTKKTTVHRFGNELPGDNGTYQQLPYAAMFLNHIQNRNSSSNILLWLQRNYLHSLCKEYQSYDPTSGYDDDFPIELDHLIPQSIILL